MADIVITSSVDQDRALAYFVGRGQAEDATSLVRAIMSQQLNDLVVRAKEDTVGSLAARLADADDETLGEIAAILDRRP